MTQTYLGIDAGALCERLSISDFVLSEGLSICDFLKLNYAVFFLQENKTVARTKSKGLSFISFTAVQIIRIWKWKQNF